MTSQLLSDKNGTSVLFWRIEQLLRDPDLSCQHLPPRNKEQMITFFKYIDRSTYKKHSYNIWQTLVGDNTIGTDTQNQTG